MRCSVKQQTRPFGTEICLCARRCPQSVLLLFPGRAAPRCRQQQTFRCAAAIILQPHLSEGSIGKCRHLCDAGVPAARSTVFSGSHHSSRCFAPALDLVRSISAAPRVRVAAASSAPRGSVCALDHRLRVGSSRARPVPRRESTSSGSHATPRGLACALEHRQIAQVTRRESALQPPPPRAASRALLAASPAR